MADPDFAAFALVPKGHAFEDFHDGQVFEHHWGRTLNEGDNSLFATMALRFLPLYFNAEYARAHGHPGVVVDALLETAREFAMREVLPVANRLDPVQGEMPMELRQKMAELGYFGILIPQEYGGLGLGIFEYVLVTEELARAWMSVASIIARGNGIGAGFSEDKRREMLPKMARGECLGAFPLSEPGAGSDVASIRCRAELVGDEWVVNGQKMWCTFADGADFIILVARATPYDPEHRHAGIAQFLIEKERGTFPPGIAGTPMRKVGYHGWKTWELSFDNFRIPKANIRVHSARSGSSEGFKRTAMALSVARIHTAARSVGLA